MSRKFKWDKWNYDCQGDAYIIAKDQCPSKENVPVYIVENDNLHPDVFNPSNGEHLCLDIVQEGWCKYQVRTDWEDGDGEPMGGYFVLNEKHDTSPHKGKAGWFPVWIVRSGEWY